MVTNHSYIFPAGNNLAFWEIPKDSGLISVFAAYPVYPVRPPNIEKDSNWDTSTDISVIVLLLGLIITCVLVLCFNQPNGR
ncbi:hypothetical protein [Picosynechococcus sp. PCC 7117]|uniref:hypothetical protein n=1 Tax=Picosynechococcus sp. PCC 7117 TaxID=195498 RepID=UPI000810590E|nr:hypothetical protein [Picosynechococcus sp. PCC 7117]ANV87302.1 hypothetical protein AWQ22_07420 [Picosynechococcus sp. PCC 7117]